jgi:predicted phage baseplate assembly protein
MGSGDATNPALQFTLKQTPLTFISSSTASGSTSTLQVWVNNLEWHEVDNFLASGPNDRVFITRMDDSRKVTVQFGDGERGARPPSGQMNIRVVYRKGIGAAGMVQAGKLTQPLDRPQGLNSSTNPDSASGGADPDTADAARASAPLHVLVLDRVVSLEDYENFARAFAGIDKALATWTWFGRTRGVFLSVAGANGAVLKADDPALVNLVKALRSSGNPFVPLQVASYTPVLFEIGALVKIDTANYDSSLVLAAAWQVLSAGFSFKEREIGQGVAQSEVIAALQSVAGVIAVTQTVFKRQGDDPVLPLPVVLHASAPLPGGQGTPQAAEMLLLDPASQGNLGVWS